MAAFDVFIKVGSMEANGGQRPGADSNIGHCICVDSNGGHYIGADCNAHAHQPPLVLVRSRVQRVCLLPINP